MAKRKTGDTDNTQDPEAQTPQESGPETRDPEQTETPVAASEDSVEGATTEPDMPAEESPESQDAAENAADDSATTETTAEAEAAEATVATPEPEPEPDPTSTAPDPSPAPTPPAQTTTVIRKGGFVSTLSGGILAAVIGAGAVIYALPNLPPQIAGWLPKPPQPAQTEMDQAISAQGQKLDQLAQDIAALKSAPAPSAPDLSGIDGKLDKLDSQIAANAKAIESLKTTIGNLNASGDAASAQSQAAIEAAAKAAQEQIKQAEEQAQKLRDQAEASAKAAMAQAAGARVKAALDGGMPLAPALADLQAAGVAVPSALQGDVPSLQSLQESFADPARKALNVARETQSGASVTDRLGAFLLAQTGARSLTPKEGDGPDAVLSRAQADVDSGDLQTAIDEIAKLPEPAQQPLADWVSAAKTRIAAVAAARQLGQSN